MTTTTAPTNNSNFNIDTFNKNFDIIHSRTNKINNKIENDTLDKLNNTEYEKEIIDLSLSEIIINMFSSWLSIFDDINKGKFKNLLTKKHRLFYIGLTIFIIGLSLYLFDFFIESDDKNNNKTNKTDNKTDNKTVNETRNIVINKYYNVNSSENTETSKNTDVLKDVILPINLYGNVEPSGNSEVTNNLKK